MPPLSTAKQPARPAAHDLLLLVFVVGTGSLGAEIAAVRLLAPFFGASTVVWANTIGVVLVALSLGYWLGGRLADRHPHKRGLCLLALAAAALLALVPFVADPLLGVAVDALDEISAGAFLGSLLAVLVLVAVPVLLLGAVSPYAIRLAVTTVEEAGTVAGRLYATSTAGSLVGTLLSALVLIPLVGTRRTFLIFALAISLVAVLGLWPARRYALAPAAIALLIALPVGTLKAKSDDGKVIYETETPYQYARVIEQRDGTRLLELNEGQAFHSYYRPHDPLTGHYTDGALVLPFLARGRAPARLAVLGNAGGSLSRSYEAFFPRTRVDGVEIDGELSDIGRRFFDMNNPRLRVHDEDARPWLRKTNARFDSIFVDAYRQPYIPFYLATREFFELVRDHLTPAGVVIINVGHPKGERTVEKALAATMRAALPHVVRDPIEDTNTLLVASQAPLSARRLDDARLPRRLRALALSAAADVGAPLAGGEVWTDDRAPVEWATDRAIVDYAARD